MTQLKFDEAMAKALEAVYQKRDMVRRRGLVREALGAAPGERILDVGSGPGFYVTELLEEVGPKGSIVAVDTSPDMLAIARRRCTGHDNVTFHEGNASSIPVEDAGFDGALCIQVMEYVTDPAGALAEIHRALRPGGRAVIWDIDWATVWWHSSDPDRMRRVLAAWDEHLAHPSLPRTLAARMRAAGFEDVRAQGHSFATIEFDPEAFAVAILGLIGDYVRGRGGVSEDEVTAWAAEQQELGERAEFFFEGTQFCFTGSKAR
jgi:arsenite methyltransferase